MINVIIKGIVAGVILGVARYKINKLMNEESDKVTVRDYDLNTMNKVNIINPSQDISKIVVPINDPIYGVPTSNDIAMTHYEGCYRPILVPNIWESDMLDFEHFLYKHYDEAKEVYRFGVLQLLFNNRKVYGIRGNKTFKTIKCIPNDVSDITISKKYDVIEWKLYTYNDSEYVLIPTKNLISSICTYDLFVMNADTLWDGEYFYYDGILNGNLHKECDKTVELDGFNFSICIPSEEVYNNLKEEKWIR